MLQDSGVVAATMAGHTHQNGYVVDACGIHHLVLPAVVETPPGRDAYGIVEVLHDRLLLKGADTCMSATIKLSEAAVRRQQLVLQRLAAEHSTGNSSSSGGLTSSSSSSGCAGSAQQHTFTTKTLLAAASGSEDALAGGADAVVEVADDVQALQGKPAAAAEAGAVHTPIQACTAQLAKLKAS